jgi:hypothetical protein
MLHAAGALAGGVLAAGACMAAAAAAPVAITAAVLGGVLGAVAGGAIGREVPRGVPLDAAMEFDQTTRVVEGEPAGGPAGVAEGEGAPTGIAGFFFLCVLGGDDDAAMCWLEGATRLLNNMLLAIPCTLCAPPQANQHRRSGPWE